MKATYFLVVTGMILSGCSTLLEGRPCSVSENSNLTPVIHQIVKPKKIEAGSVIYFADGSYRLTTEEKNILRQVAQKAERLNAEIIIRGHASSRTRPASAVEHTLINLNISSRRALVVAETLARYGIPLRQMRYEALSDSHPAEPEINRRAEAFNRRVEIFYAY